MEGSSKLGAGTSAQKIEDTDSAPVAENICTVIRNDAVNDRYKHLVLDAPETALGVEPGQFFHLLCPRQGGASPFLRRPMSLYRVDRAERRVEFLYKVTGEGTSAMAALRPGEAFNILGPLGRGFRLAPDWRALVLVARGVGLATLAPLAQLAADEGRSLVAICSAQAPEYLMSLDYFRDRGADVIALTDSEGTSSVDNLRRILERLIAGGRADAFFTCGSNRMLELLRELSLRHGIPGQIALEQQMACGLGMCFSCVRPFETGGGREQRRVCKEGPVFDLREAVSW